MRSVFLRVDPRPSQSDVTYAQPEITSFTLLETPWCLACAIPHKSDLIIVSLQGNEYGVRYIGSKMLEDLHILHVNHELLVSIDALQLLRYLICVLKLWINATRQDLTDNSFQFFWLQKIHELVM